MNATLSARELAFQSLTRHEKNNGFSNLELDNALKRNPLPPNEKSLFTVLFYGVLEKSITLDHWIARLCDTSHTLSLPVRTALRLGLYQLAFMDRIPQNAAVNESVNLVKKTSEHRAASLVNAVLRRACRMDLGQTLKEMANEPARWSVAYSYPQWMIDLWLNAYGSDSTRRILEEQNKPAPLCLCVNTLKTTLTQAKRELEMEGAQVQTVEDLPRALIVTNSFAIGKSQALSQGHVFVQDLASQRACQLLAPAPGDRVMDICCCPGGKSFHAAILMKNLGTLRAFDLHSSKLSLVEKGAEKMGIQILEAQVNNGTVPCADWDGWADKIICDVPCSGLGVIAKKPDIRQKNQQDIERLPSIQAQILQTSSRYLKPGGTLLYSTCTLNPAENQDITNTFLNNNPQFHRVQELGMPLTIFPKGSTNDGFFIDLIRRDK